MEEIRPDDIDPVNNGSSVEPMETDSIPEAQIELDHANRSTDDLNAPQKDDSGETTDTSSEKNESKDFEDDDTISCIDCKVKDCIMWRTVKDGNQNSLVCNLCHLKRVKGATSNQGSSNGGGTSNTKTNQAALVKSNKEIVRISKRKNKTNKKFANGIYGDKFIKNGNSKNRRSYHKKKPVKSAMGISSIVASQSIYHNGLLYQVGDIVCTSDVEGGTYYAQLRGFLQDDYCERGAVITWLIPTQRNIQKFDPLLFLPGLDEDTPRPMECFDFVCRASTGLFKTRNTHPPYLRSQTDLNNLIYVANALNNTQKEQQSKDIDDQTGT